MLLTFSFQLDSTKLQLQAQVNTITVNALSQMEECCMIPTPLLQQGDLSLGKVTNAFNAIKY